MIIKTLHCQNLILLTLGDIMGYSKLSLTNGKSIDLTSLALTTCAVPGSVWR